MYHRTHQPTAKTGSRLTPAHQVEAPTIETAAHPEVLTRTAASAGGAPDPAAQAERLNRASDGRLHRAGQVLLQMQRDYGNRYVQQVVNHARQAASPAPLIQTKLVQGRAGDRYEQEADRVADEVMRMPAVERHDLDEGEKPKVMRASAETAGGAFEAGEAFEQKLHGTRGQGQPLLPTLREEFETTFGADFSGVRIHTDVRSAEMNRAIQAKGFTYGQDIYLGAGQYSAGSAEGKRLLAHELTHVVQQSINNELQENPRHNGRDEQRNGTTSEGHLSATGHNLKRLGWAHPRLVLNRVTPQIQPKRAQILDSEWDDHLDAAVTSEKKAKAEKHYNDSQARGKKIRDSYEAWKSKKPEQQAGTKGSTRTFRSKGYKTDIEARALEEFAVKTYRKLELLFTLDEAESKTAQSALESKDTNEIKDILQRQNAPIHGELEISRQTGTRNDLVWKNGTFEFEMVKSPEWQIRDKGEPGTKSDSDRYGRTYIARLNKDLLDNLTVEFHGFKKTPDKPESIPYSNIYSLQAGKFTAKVNFKEWEEDKAFAEANSEIIWNQYKSAIKDAKSASNKQDLKYAGNLSEIERNTIVNQQTLDTIFLCNEGGKVLKAGEKAMVRPEGQDSEDFWTLIGTPNGTAAGYLLIDHGTALGLESFESIEYQRMQMNIKYRKR